MSVAAEGCLPPGYSLRVMASRDYSDVSAICAIVYPTEQPYTQQELATHHRVFPAGQFVVEHEETRAVAGAHLTLVLDLRLFHLDDSWEMLTAGGSFSDHDPSGHTLYGADLFVHPEHQHHGIARALTLATRDLVRALSLWRMVGGSRMPGYARVAAEIAPDDYIRKVKRGDLTDPVLTAHLHDGWDVLAAIRGYLPHDVESAGWAAVIQWLNPARPLPPEFDLTRMQRRG